MTWGTASLKAIAIVAYFVVFTVWLPSWLLGLDAVAQASAPVRDAIAVVTWTVTLGAGIFGLRNGQRKGLI
jgi:hypothetical protein